MIRQLVFLEFEGKWGCSFSVNLGLSIGSVVVWIKQIVLELPNQRACQGFLFGDCLLYTSPSPRD